MRNYDDGLGRFTSVDADWELYRDLTPYNYAENNPLVLKDPSGFGPGDRDDYQDKNLPMRHIGGGSGGSRTAPSVGYNSTAKPSAPKAPKSQTSSGSKRGSGGNSGVGGGTTPSDNQAVSMSSERYPMQQAKGADVTPKTSNAARREVMRQQNIPTSQQPKSQSKNASGREYTYEVPAEGGGTTTKSVQQQTMDRSHQGENHWEAGRVKVRDGNVQMNNYNRPKLESDKSKVDYQE